jgi:hypothetical protein
VNQDIGELLGNISKLQGEICALKLQENSTKERLKYGSIKEKPITMDLESFLFRTFLGCFLVKILNL